MAPRLLAPHEKQLSNPAARIVVTGGRPCALMCAIEADTGLMKMWKSYDGKEWTPIYEKSIGN